jgi:hypothetical protein
MARVFFDAGAYLPAVDKQRPPLLAPLFQLSAIMSQCGVLADYDRSGDGTASVLFGQNFAFRWTTIPSSLILPNSS